MKKLVLCACLLLVPFAFTDSAEAQAACFTWTCDSGTRVCNFNASCSDDTPLHYRWTYGDGSPIENYYTGNPYASHTYPMPKAFFNVTLSVGYLFIGYYDVTCQIQVHSVVGPPEPSFSGTCS